MHWLNFAFYKLRDHFLTRHKIIMMKMTDISFISHTPEPNTIQYNTIQYNTNLFIQSEIQNSITLAMNSYLPIYKLRQVYIHTSTTHIIS